MANSFITIKEIARLALPRLIENLVFPNLVYKDYSNDFVKGKGAKIQVRKPVVLTAQDFNPATGTTAQDVKEDSVEVTLDRFATVDVAFSDIEMAVNVDDLTRLYIEPAAVALAQKINADGLELYKDIPYATGTAGTTPSSIGAFADARKLLNTHKVPVEGRKALWDPEADAKFSQIEAILNAEKSGSTEALRNGSIGRVMGFDNYMSQAVKTHANGTMASMAVDGAVSEGATVIHVDGGTGTETVTKGTIITIGGVNYTVTEDAVCTGGECDLNVYPAVPAAIKDNTAVTITAGHTANLVFNPNAFAFVTRPLAAPSGVESYVTSYNGLTLRVVKGYDMKYKREMLSMDILYGYKTMYPEMAARVLG